MRDSVSTRRGIFGVPHARGMGKLFICSTPGGTITQDNLKAIVSFMMMSLRQE